MREINDKTNVSLKLIAELCDSQYEDQDMEFPITLSANGQLITGLITSKRNFLKAKENSSLNLLGGKLSDSLKENFANLFEVTEDNTSLTLKKGLTQDEFDTIPDWFFQDILYLRDASYISGGLFISNPSTTIQVRISDIASYSLVRVSR